MVAAAYERIEAALAAGEYITLDGGVASEVAEAPAGTGDRRRDPWAIYEQTSRVVDVHRRYAAAGCDVVSTNTWGLLGCTVTGRGRRPGRTGLPAWTVAARDAVWLARRGILDAERTGHCAVAFSLNDADPLLMREQGLLSLLWAVDPPDLVLVETLPMPPSGALVDAIGEVAATGLPVWVSFRRTRAAADEPSTALAATAASLERLGVKALLVNCLPVEETSRALAELAGATRLPVGCYPRLDRGVDPTHYAALCARWRAQGARIIGGCCGVGPAHMAAVRERLLEHAETSS
jgi:S-methylmethionine-dependent homocysteine/selenocysteine methylase